jgi:hypothetical protein
MTSLVMLPLHRFPLREGLLREPVEAPLTKELIQAPSELRLVASALQHALEIIFVLFAATRSHAATTRKLQPCSGSGENSTGLRSDGRPA